MLLLVVRGGHDGRLMTPTLVYLHGIGADHDDAWRDVLSAALVEAQPRESLGLTMARVAVVADPSLQGGDCIVESDLGTVDGRGFGRGACLW